MKILKKAIEHYGSIIQHMVAVEELSELQKEIIKFLRLKGDRDHLVEEIGDVEIMIKQLKIMHNIKPYEINKTVKKKLKRLQERMNNE